MGNIHNVPDMRKVPVLTWKEWVTEVTTQCSRETNSNLVRLDGTTAAVIVESGIMVTNSITRTRCLLYKLDLI